ncbi:MAG: CheR family methyltransferase [Promethearchaeota archaeon]
MNALKLTSFKQYLIHLANNSEEINLFIKNFIIHYPFFFNDLESFKELEKIIIAYFINSKNYINIWLYPSYSGEEAYSIAIFFEELIRKYNLNLDFKINASYFNKFTLVKALKGIYSENELLKTPPEIINSYFKKKRKIGSKNLFLIKDCIKKKVDFLSEGIIMGHSKLVKYDIIFCRFFLNYLTKKSQEKLLKIFDNQSKQGSLLVLGLGQNLREISSNLEPLNLTRHIYRKSNISLKKIKIPKIVIHREHLEIKSNEDELYIPAAQYAIVHSNQKPSNLVIYGLGSCIALILRDLKSNIHGMSHILLPDSSIARNDEYLHTPHKYIDTSIKELKNELINHGAREENIKAIVVGGASVINVDHLLNNSEIILKELKSFSIKVEKSDLGGRKGRSIIYNAKDGSVLVKKAGENDYRRL